MAKKNTSPNKVEANRRNAKKSTGPRSAAGKAKASRNAVKHGLLAQKIVLADNPEEDPQEFGLLLDGLLEDYQPHGTFETMLVERLAASFWRLRRAYRFEVESITLANEPHPLGDVLDEIAKLPPRRRSEHILPRPHMMESLVRYETMIDRELLRTMRQLEMRQRLRKIEQAPDQPAQAQSPSSRALQGPGHLPVAATAVRGLKATAQDRGAEDPRQEDARKAPAPNEPTATPGAGSATSCDRRNGSGGSVPRAVHRARVGRGLGTANSVLCHGRVGRAPAITTTSHRMVPRYTGTPPPSLRPVGHQRNPAGGPVGSPGDSAGGGVHASRLVADRPVVRHNGGNT